MFVSRIGTRLLSQRTLSTIPMRHQYMFKKENLNSVVLPPHLSGHTIFQKDADFPDPRDELVQPGKRALIGGWLLLTAGGVFFMVMLGGYTRLSHSGLSMTKWKPIEYKYPQDDEQWNHEFEHYKQFPEFTHAPHEVTLQKFKRIYTVEYLHRVSGSTLGAIYVLPLVAFSLSGWIRPKFTKRLAAIGSLGLAQGLIGWWMVKSGLDPKPEYQNRPRVSTYRLVTHFSLATTLYSLLLWNAMTVLKAPQHKMITPENYQGFKKMRLLGIALIHCVAINLLTGGTMAGIDAGKVYNTWPLMNGQVVPAGLLKKEPLYLNLFENVACVQFNHRNAAYITYFVSAYTVFTAYKLKVPNKLYLAAFSVFGFINLQILLGIITLLNQAPLHDASVHQFHALNTLTAVLIMMHFARKPSPVYAKYLKQFV